jgi:hypothetical protein
LNQSTHSSVAYATASDDRHGPRPGNGAAGNWPYAGSEGLLLSEISVVHPPVSIERRRHEQIAPVAIAQPCTPCRDGKQPFAERLWMPWEGSLVTPTGIVLKFQ